MDMDFVEIGKNIRAQRVMRYLSQAALAEKVDVTSQHICHIETSQSKPSLQLLVLIANALNIDVNTLLGSNAHHNRTEVLNAEIARVLEHANENQLQLCAELCRTGVNFDLTDK